jgi:hypothetical protein
MKKLFSQHEQGYSWSNRHNYYLCETDEEYQKIIDEYGDYILDKVHSPFLNVYVGKLRTTPQTSVSDGFAVSGGHEFDAYGVTLCYKSGTPTMDSSSYEHYIKPNSIKKHEVEKVHGWWV